MTLLLIVLQCYGKNECNVNITAELLSLKEQRNGQTLVVIHL